MLEGILTGVTTAFTPLNLSMVFIGCFSGTFIGMLPGLGPISAIALMIPITYGFDPATGMILMAGVYYGAVFGGSTSSILINAPGVAGTVATAFDGYPMARAGNPGRALAIAAYSSFAGGTVATILLLVAAPALASVSLSFRSADYFLLMVLGLTAISAFAGRGQFLKAIMMTVLGLMLATIGQDVASDVPRFTFGSMDLLDGISFLLLAMAVFALSEGLMIVLRRGTDEETDDAGLKAMPKRARDVLKLPKEDIRDMAPVVARSSILGFFVGILPGAGATIASFLAYGIERAIAPLGKRELFGKGSVRGLAAPETANNAACSGSFVPLLTLGIPGSGTTAVMLGALISYGVQPGPQLYIDRPEVFWSVIISMYIGNVILLTLNLPLIPWIAKVILIPKQILVPLILFFSMVGVYLVSFNTMDIFMMVGFALGAVFLRLLDFPLPPLILSFVLGRMLEENLARAMVIYDGSWSFLWDRPLTLGILIVTCLTLLIPIRQAMQKNDRSDQGAD